MCTLLRSSTIRSDPQIKSTTARSESIRSSSISNTTVPNQRRTRVRIKDSLLARVQGKLRARSTTPAPLTTTNVLRSSFPSSTIPERSSITSSTTSTTTTTTTTTTQETIIPEETTFQVILSNP